MDGLKNSGVNGYDIANAICGLLSIGLTIASVITGTKANNVRFNYWSNKWNQVQTPNSKIKN